MNIVHLLSQNHLTGAEVYAATLAQKQIQLGFNVFQISNGFYYPTQAENTQLPVETKSRLRFIKNVFFLRRFLKEKNINVIHTHSRAAAKLAYWATLLKPVAVVSTVHGQQHSSVSKKIFNQYGEFMIAVCENIQKHLINDFGYNPFRIKVIRNPIDENLFSFQAQKNIQSNEFKIAIIGRTTGPKKIRTEKTLLAIQKLIESDFFKDQKCLVTLVGGFLENLNISDHFKKNIQEVQIQSLTSDHYRHYDLVIGSGRVCMESIITGVPTIAFGETEYLGLVQLNNLTVALSSNFGDISLHNKINALDVDFNQFKNDILNILDKKIDLHDLQNLSLTLLKEFSTTSLIKKINRLYESAVFLKNKPNWIPILMYHKIPNQKINSAHQIFVTSENFEKHLLFFKNKGFQTLTFSDLHLFRTGQKSLKQFPKKPLILTFDDGYADNYENASPLLKKYNFKAQIFLLANTKLDHNQWDTQSQQDGSEPKHAILSEAERLKWLTSEFEVGSHGFNHQKITQMSTAEALTELRDSKKSLEAEFKKNVYVYAFTYGDTNSEYATLAAEAGYEYAVNTDTGAFHIEEDPFQIFRVNIFPNESSFSLWKKTSTWYRRYYYWKRKK